MDRAMAIWQLRGAVVMVALELACSSEGGRTRDPLPVAPPQGPVAMGAPAAPPSNAGASAPTVGVAAPGADGVAASAPPLVDPSMLIGGRLGEPLEFVAGTGMVPYAIGPNEYGINGGGFLARSMLGNSVTVGTEPGKICISGSLDQVPLNPDGHGNYGQYWGVEFGFNLNQEPAAGAAAEVGAAEPVAAAPPSDAGATPAAMDVAQPWHPGSVVGFSFVIEGSTIDLVRFKSLPDGFDSAQESSVFCKEFHATSGTPNAALFSELSTFCWGGINMLIPTSAGLDNISWQLPADVIGPRPFDWCLSDLRPILAP